MLLGLRFCKELDPVHARLDSAERSACTIGLCGLARKFLLQNCLLLLRTRRTGHAFVGRIGTWRWIGRSELSSSEVFGCGGDEQS